MAVSPILSSATTRCLPLRFDPVVHLISLPAAHAAKLEGSGEILALGEPVADVVRIEAQALGNLDVRDEAVTLGSG